MSFTDREGDEASSFDEVQKVLRGVLGQGEQVDRALVEASDFGRPLQELLSEYGRGAGPGSGSKEPQVGEVAANDGSLRVVGSDGGVEGDRRTHLHGEDPEALGGRPTVGFVGLGVMGSRMASRLLDVGYRLIVHDARREASAAIVAAGATFVSTPREVADAAEVVLVSLPSPQVTNEVVAGTSGLCGGASMRCFVDLSTTGPQAAIELAALLDGAGAAYVDAPVSGGPAGAETGRLTLMVAGPPAAVAFVKPILDRLGSKIFIVGDKPGQGQLVKVINNLLSASAIAITAEGVALGVRGGVEPGVLLDVVGASSGSNTAVLDKFPRQVLTRRFDHGFRLQLMAKDVKLCLGEARRHNVPMLLGGTVEQLWTLAERQSEPTDDCTAIVRMIEEWASTTIVGGAN